MSDREKEVIQAKQIIAAQESAQTILDVARQDIINEVYQDNANGHAAGFAWQILYNAGLHIAELKVTNRVLDNYFPYFEGFDK